VFFWFTFVGAGYLVFISPLLLPPPKGRPPFPVQREEQRKLVRERVVAAGGWEVLRRECESLFTNKSGFYWEPPKRSGRYETNIDYGPLPSALASLRPHKITAYGLTEQPPVADISLFGAHMTGMRGIPYYGLLIISGSAPDGYTPEPTYSGLEIKRISDYVFEYYQP